MSTRINQILADIDELLSDPESKDEAKLLATLLSAIRGPDDRIGDEFYPLFETKMSTTAHIRATLFPKTAEQYRNNDSENTGWMFAEQRYPYDLSKANRGGIHFEGHILQADAALHAIGRPLS
jgi:hypothetical protein